MGSVCIIIWGILNGVVIFGLLKHLDILRVSEEYEDIGKYIIKLIQIISR